MDTETAYWAISHAQHARVMYEDSLEARWARRRLLVEARYHYGAALYNRLMLLGYTPRQAYLEVWGWREMF